MVEGVVGAVARWALAGGGLTRTMTCQCIDGGAPSCLVAEGWIVYDYTDYREVHVIPEFACEPTHHPYPNCWCEPVVIERGPSGVVYSHKRTQ